MDFDGRAGSEWNNVLLSNDGERYGYELLMENEHYGKTRIRGEYKYDVDLGDLNLLKEGVLEVVFELGRRGGGFVL